MSRCFPFPPPNFGEAGIEPLKLHKEREKAKKDRRKEKKRVRKEKVNQEHENLAHSKYDCKKRKYDDWNILDQKSSAFTKTSNDAVEQLEKSSLTEDHELQYSNQHMYSSPESSQDSIKKGNTASANHSQSNNGFIFRIRLPSMKQRDPEPASIMPIVNMQAPELLTVLKRRHLEPSRVMKQSNPVPIDETKKQSICVAIPGNQRAKQQQTCILKLRGRQQEPSTAEQKQPDVLLVKEEPCCSGRDSKMACQSEAVVTTHNHFSIEKKKQSAVKMERRFKELILNLSPLSLQPEQSDVSDQEWLFNSSKRHFTPTFNLCKVGKVLPSHKDLVSLEQPRACYLPEFGVYQLPYVIPY